MAREPQVMLAPIKIPQPDGSWVIRTGALVLQEEVSAAEFARATGLSRRYVSQLCSTGRIPCRRASPTRRSKYLIPRTEIVRLRTAVPE